MLLLLPLSPCLLLLLPYPSPKTHSTPLLTGVSLLSQPLTVARVISDYELLKLKTSCKFFLDFLIALMGILITAILNILLGFLLLFSLGVFSEKTSLWFIFTDIISPSSSAFSTNFPHSVFSMFPSFCTLVTFIHAAPSFNNAHISLKSGDLSVTANRPSARGQYWYTHIHSHISYKHREPRTPLTSWKLLTLIPYLQATFFSSVSALLNSISIYPAA